MARLAGLNVLPNLPKSDIGNGALTNTERFAHGDLPMTSLEKPSNFADSCIRKLSVVMNNASRLCKPAFFKTVSVKNILKSRNPFQVDGTSIITGTVLVVYLVSRWLWADKSQRNKNVYFSGNSSSINADADLRIPGGIKRGLHDSRVSAQRTALGPRHPANPPKIRNLIVRPELLDGLPMFRHSWIIT